MRTLEQIRRDVVALPTEEQQQLREWLDRILESPAESSKLIALERDMFEAGLLSEIKPRPKDDPFYEEPELIEIQGKPLYAIVY